MEKWRVLGKAGLFRLGNYELYGSLLALHINEVVASITLVPEYVQNILMIVMVLFEILFYDDEFEFPIQY